MYMLHILYIINIICSIIYTQVYRESEREQETSPMKQKDTFSWAEHLVNKADVKQLTIFVFL